MDIQIHLVGPTTISPERLSKQLRRFQFLSNVSIDEISASIPLSAPAQFVSDLDAAKLIPSPKKPQDVSFGIFPVMLESNWFVRYLPDGKVAGTTFDVEDREIEYWSTEKILAYMLLKFCLVKKFLQSGGVYEKLYTREFERSIFNFATNKDHAFIALQYLTIGGRARAVLSNSRITDGELRVFESDLQSLKPSLLQKAERTLRKNIWVSLGTSFVLGIIGKWVVTLLKI